MSSKFVVPRMREFLNSLTGRLVTHFGLATFAILLVSALLLDLHLGEAFEKESHEFLEDSVEVVRSIATSHPGDLDYLVLEVEGETAARKYQKTYIRVLDPKGKLLAETPGMGEVLPLEVFRGGELLGHLHHRDSALEEDFLLVERRLDPRKTQSLRIQAALDLGRFDRLRQSYRRSLAWMILFGLLVAILSGIGITRLGLLPLRELGEVANRITVLRLSERIGDRVWPQELSEIAASFDAMLERLEVSFRRISDFSDDLAHEFRTPLANLRLETEHALRSSRSPEDIEEVLVSNLEELERLSAMVEEMLFLARSGDPKQNLGLEALSAEDEIQAVFDLYEPLAEDRGVDLEIFGQGEIRANSELLRRALSNLLSNALRHSPRGGVIRAEVQREGSSATRISIEDQGPGIPPEDRDRIFERFFRGDRSRAFEAGSSGLGLAIVREILDLHGGRVWCEPVEPTGARLILELP